MKSKYFWRQVETGDANKIEFTRGGEKLLLLTGGTLLFLCVICVWIFFQLVPEIRDEISNYLQMKEYRLAASVYLLAGIPQVIILEYFILGAWMIFGRVTIVINKTLGTITKDYRVRSFSLYTRSYQTGGLSSISFRRIGDVRRILFLSALYLNRKDGTSAKLLLAPKKYQKEGRTMAGQIAAFLGIPGPDK